LIHLWYNNGVNDSQKVEYLSKDTAFGILTRPALELAMSEAKGAHILYIIDFDDIHKLNMQLGYNKVNETIRESIGDLIVIFGGLIIGRVFSGDEIAILDYYNHANLIESYAEICVKYELGFRWADSNINLGRPPSYHAGHLNALSKKLQSSKFAKML